MGELILKEKLGDISFGVPKDISDLNMPYGFYDFLGVARNASKDEIHRAYLKKARIYHPDHGGNEEKYKALEKVKEILMDENPDYSRIQYDRVSKLDSYFDGFIEKKGQRTKKLSEFMLMEMQAEAETKELESRFPEYKRLRSLLKRASSETTRTKHIEEIRRIELGAKNLPPNVIDQQIGIMKEMRERRKKEGLEFLEALRSHHDSYLSRILDLYYIGNKAVTFGVDERMIRLGILGHKITDNILFLLLTGECYISGTKQVHFKSENCNVTIQDPHMKGIVHVINGDISIDYQESSYGEVIRARAPDVEILGGFVRDGDLFVPERFAKTPKKKPALDVAVEKGKITLDLRSQKIAPIAPYYNIYNDLLKSEIIGNNKDDYKDYFKIIKK